MCPEVEQRNSKKKKCKRSWRLKFVALDINGKIIYFSY